MGFQTTVNVKQPYGIVGEMHDSSVKRVTAYDLGADCTIGKPAYRIAASGKVTDTYASGTAAEFLGVFVNPKEYVINDGSLAATLVMKKENGAAAQVASLGHINVVAKVAVKAGDPAYYNDGWVKTAGTASDSVDAAKKGLFITDAGAGEVTTISIDVVA